MNILALYNPNEIGGSSLYNDNKLKDRNSFFKSELKRLNLEGDNIRYVSIDDYLRLVKEMDVLEYKSKNTADREVKAECLDKAIRTIPCSILDLSAENDCVIVQPDNYYTLLCDLMGINAYRLPQFSQKGLTVEEKELSELRTERGIEIFRNLVEFQQIGIEDRMPSGKFIVSIGSDFPLPAVCSQFDNYQLHGAFSASAVGTSEDVIRYNPAAEKIRDFTTWIKLNEVFNFAQIVYKAIHTGLALIHPVCTKNHLTLYLPHEELLNKANNYRQKKKLKNGIFDCL